MYLFYILLFFCSPQQFETFSLEGFAKIPSTCITLAFDHWTLPRSYWCLLKFKPVTKLSWHIIFKDNPFQRLDIFDQGGGYIFFNHVFNRNSTLGKIRSVILGLLRTDTKNIQVKYKVSFWYTFNNWKVAWLSQNNISKTSKRGWSLLKQSEMSHSCLHWWELCL